MRVLLPLVASIACLSFATAAFPTTAFAQRSLYGRQPGRDAVFVRFVNALDTDVSVKADALPTQKLGTGSGDRVGRYVLLDRADAAGLTITAKAGTAELRSTIPLTPGSKVSVLLRSDGDALRAVGLSARSELNQTRTVLSFYNAAPDCGPASLLLEPAKAVVFPDVPVDAERSRGINPVAARFATACGDRGLATAELEQPESGGSYSAWLLVLQGRPTLVFGTDTLPTWKP